jgi:mannan endo-1,4-beta-mannosidase
MPQYVRWCAPGASVDAFYSNARCRQLYKSYVKHLLTRVNTVNHRVYRDDPTVFAWELANEPRSGDRSGRTIRRWVAEMAAYVRALDRRHMITTGEEGFDITAAGYSSMAAYNNQGWLFNGSSGVAFTANTADPNISFGSIHLYPEYWSLGVTGGSTWITDHIRVARRLGKPLVVGEFGFSNNPAPVFDTWIKAFERNNGAGALVWQIICQACQNYGGFSTIYPPTTAVSYVLGSAAARANRKSLSPLPTTEATQDAPTDD